MTVIKVASLCKNFGSLEAVKDLSFDVNEGQIFGFLGQNGSGKSTTIRMLLSLIHPTSGDIHIFGKEKQKYPTINKINTIKKTTWKKPNDNTK